MKLSDAAVVNALEPFHWKGRWNQGHLQLRDRQDSIFALHLREPGPRRVFLACDFAEPGYHKKSVKTTECDSCAGRNIWMSFVMGVIRALVEHFNCYS